MLGFVLGSLSQVGRPEPEFVFAAKAAIVANAKAKMAIETFTFFIVNVFDF